LAGKYPKCFALARQREIPYILKRGPRIFFDGFDRGAMQNPLVMTIMGMDRTGLVESIARLITEHGGNWLESRMCRLGGRFTGILRIHVPHGNEGALINALQGLQAQNMNIAVYPDLPQSFSESGRMAVLSLVGQDRPGIIHQISATLASQKVNVEELETECFSAPMSGEMTFRAFAKLHIPESCIVSNLRAELENIGSELMVDISFSET
jgi:glycine cleavage system regulatory protein